MKLTEIQIDCHGAWRNLTLPVQPNSLSVFYGPNEAGKLTLRQFIAGVLFGFSTPEEQIGRVAAGSLQIEDASGRHRVHRVAVGAAAGEAGLAADDAVGPAVAVLEASLRGIDRQLFERIFEVDLGDLTDLDSLSRDDVAKHLFGTSPGPTGARLLAAARRVEERRSLLIDPLQKEGRLVELFEQRDDLTARLREVEHVKARHSEWSLRRDQLEAEITDVRKRLTGTSEQLRGHEFLQNVWGPWDRIRDCRRELGELPEIAEFPERGLERLEKIENEIAEAAERRDHLHAEVQQMREAALHPSGGTAWRSQAAAMRGFVDQREWLAGLQQRRQQARQNAADGERVFVAACEQLGADWSAARVASADVSTAAQRRLSGTAESFLSALSRRRAIKRKCRRIAEARRDLKESLAESLHDLDGRSIDTALAEAREGIVELNRMAASKLREVELAQRLETLNQHRDRIVPQLQLPTWVYFILGVFAFMGVILAGWGLVAAVATSGIAGAIYAMLGITCGGLAWGLKIQYEGDARQRLGEIETASAAAASELKILRDSIRRVAGDDPAAGDLSALVCQAQDKIGELVELAAHQRKLQGMRRNLAACRKKLETAHREVGTARQNWNELLAKFGFPESVRVDEALAAWQLLAVAAERLSAWNLSRRELQTVSEIWDSYRQRIVDLGRRLPEGSGEGADPLEVLFVWHDRLAALERGRDDRRDVRARLRLKRREAREYDRQVEKIKLKRNALLVQGGASDRDEFDERARLFARRTFLKDQLLDAQRDLDAACAGHGDLALVEEDLERFEPRENSECIETLRLELADLERDLERAFEHLAGIKREIETLEHDNQATKLRFELRQVDDQLRTLVADWAVCESASRTIEDIRRDFERTHQPPALADAAKMFARMTCHKYGNVWVPLGERRIIVEDDRGRSFPVQSLSRGTREQLLLAVRLAVVRDLARQGISLPVILDDVIVNFDEERAAATVALLLELAAQGQQLLFVTCHKHLAQLFASHGVEPVWLPRHSDPAAESDEKRLAG